MLLRVNPPVIVAAPLNRLTPKTANVVVGAAVPIPTRPSLALATKVEVSITSEWAIVEVTDVDCTLIAADVLVGLKTFVALACHAPFTPVSANAEPWNPSNVPVQSPVTFKAPQEKAPASEISCNQLLAVQA